MVYIIDGRHTAGGGWERDDERARGREDGSDTMEPDGIMQAASECKQQ